MKSEFSDLVNLLKGHTVYVQMHDFPDPDAIASACGLQALLKWKGIDSTIVYFGLIDKINTKTIVNMLDIRLYSIDEIRDSMVSDYVVTIDGQKGNSNFSDLIGEEVACIDHHPLTSKYRYCFMKHQITGACSTIITKWIMEEHMPLSEQIATLLLYGIKMDTRNFMTGFTNDDIEAFAFLNDYADNSLIYQLDNSVLELSDLRAYSAAIENITIYNEVGFSYIPFECSDGLLASVTEFILSLASVNVSIVYAYRSEGLKFSVRSEMPSIDCGNLIQKALKGIGSGGGHYSMAGGFVPYDSLEQIEDDKLRNRYLQESFIKALEKKY